SASLSRNRRISHGHAIRSTAAFFRVTNRIYRSPSIAAGTPRAVDRPPPVGRSRQVHRVVDMHATPPATEPQLRAPQPDPGLVSRHQPDRTASVRPPLDH